MLPPNITGTALGGSQRTTYGKSKPEVSNATGEEVVGVEAEAQQGEEGQEIHDTLSVYAMGDAIGHYKATDKNRLEGSPIFFTENTPDDIQENINGYASGKDVASLAQTNKFNNDRFYRIGSKSNFLSSQTTLLPSLMQPIAKSVAEALEAFMGPKRIAMTFVGSLRDHFLSRTADGRDFLKLNNIDSSLTIQRLENRTSTVQAEIQKREAARAQLNDVLSGNQVDHYNDRRVHLQNNSESAITLLVDELMTMEQLVQFVNKIHFCADLGYALAKIPELFAKKIISYEKLLILVRHDPNFLPCLCSNSIQKAVTEGIWDVDHVENLDSCHLAAIEEYMFSREIVELGLIQGQSGFTAKLDECRYLKMFSSCLDFSKEALQNISEHKLTLATMISRSNEIDHLMNGVESKS